MATPSAVQIWMNWMGLVFFASILFVKNHKTARYTMLSMLLTMPIAIAVYAMSKNVHLFGIAHFATWLPLMIYFYKCEFKLGNIKYNSPYAIWAILLNITIVISLLFDARDIYLVAMGHK